MPSVPGANKARHSFSKGWNRLLQLRFTKPWEQRRQLTATIFNPTQSWQNSEPICPAELTPEPRGAEPLPPFLPPGSPRPQFCWGALPTCSLVQQR